MVGGPISALNELLKNYFNGVDIEGPDWVAINTFNVFSGSLMKFCIVIFYEKIVVSTFAYWWLKW